MNLIDRDLTAHQITSDTDTITTGRTTGPDKGNPTVHFTRYKLTGADKGESDCLIKPGILRLLSSVQCSEIREYLWSDVMEWIHDEYSMVGKHRLCADASAGENWY